MLRLDEGVCDSVKEEFYEMCIKISYVLVPRNDANAVRLRNWDLWGPFFMLFLFAFFVDSKFGIKLRFFSTSNSLLLCLFWRIYCYIQCSRPRRSCFFFPILCNSELLYFPNILGPYDSKDFKILSNQK